ncbi:RagB/SusD family nutrient uptake outer membrane protein [Chryseosolibacter indicus]|uniref:RagB/SusD family nutrient uptake outer membrane protein n=1 Tax=Chryseosolibacter indicus TaxID=2782351 RepID=A0ABS5VR51_9BACT|nr:RagB/SusD family nutrient uptake outer membrane protein [Chryseosolibacter indicus]MBT1703935.1 RagB/SusD family nutrient uptake outer membrane protein [Chryseosolibacter indicus]
MKSSRFSKYILLIAISIAPFYSCEDYLDVNPITEVGPDKVFSDSEGAMQALVSAYAALGGDNAYGIRLSMYYPYDNDEMMGQSGNNADNERRDIAHYNVQAGNTQLASPYDQLYRGIERANICIYYVPKMESYNNGSEQEKAELRRIYGEALTLRAQFYYELVRNWGDVSAQFEPSSFYTGPRSKVDRDVIYDRILADLEEAATLVPWRGDVPADERITQGAVRALRARIALAAGGYSLRWDQMKRRADYRNLYEIARSETKKIIDEGRHDLNPSFQAVFKDYICGHKLEPNGEIIWEVAMAGGGPSTGDSKLGYYNGPRANGKGNGALTVLPTTFYAFDPADSRRDVTCAAYDIDVNKNVTARQLNAIVDGKYRRDWVTPDVFESNGQYFGLNWVMIRYSDVLLMFAEAENELNNGPTADAINAFEKVRLRAFGGDAALIGTTPADYNGFFEAIKNERMLELCGEGVRKYDLIRWNILGQRLTEVKKQMEDLVAGNPPYQNIPSVMYYQPQSKTMNWVTSLYSPSPTTAPSGATSINWRSSTIKTTLIDVLGYAFTPNKSELLPFHTSTLEANPELGGNNYGY